MGTMLSRRAALLGSAGLFVAFRMGASAAPGATTPMTAAPAPAGKPLALDQVDAFLRIAPDGDVTVYSGKVDLGTGVRTALAQIAADELDVPFASVVVIEGDTALTPDQNLTGGSTTIQFGGAQIRLAAATARAALVDMAAARLGVPADQLTTVDGAVRTTGEPGVTLTYAELVGGAGRFDLPVRKDAPLKPASALRVVGRSVPRVDVPDKVTGRFEYVADVRLPGMMHARVVRPPAIGAKLLSVDEASVSVVSGARVVRQGDFLAVVAPTEWSAVRAAAMLKASWTEWAGLPEQAQLYDAYRASTVAKDDVTSNAGDPAAALATSAKRLQASYAWPMHTHGSIGPSCAVADVRGGRCTAWSASQATHDLRKQVAKMLGFPDEAVRLVYVAGAGCYGRNGHEDATADAALVSKLVGAPVRVQWSRADEHGWDPKGPPVLVDLQAGLNAQGALVAWQSQSWCPNHAAGTTPVLAATHAGQGAEAAGGVGNMQSNLKPEYAVPNLHTVAHRTEGAPLRPSWVRTPGRMQNCFANESFTDELAHAAGADPVAFRLRHMMDPRAIAVLQAAAERAGWERRPSPALDNEGPVARGRGIAYTRYDGVRTYVAAVANVEVERATGTIRCTRFTVAHDCGLVVNPDGLRLQLEGCVIQTVSRVLLEEVTFSRSRVTSTDWATYPILGFSGVPQVECVLLDRPDQPAWAAGEPAASVVPAAIGNAVFDAVGVRLRTVPFKPARVKEALLTNMGRNEG